MVQVVENWARIKGRLLEMPAGADSADHVLCVIGVEQVAPVEGYLNLLAWAQGQTLEVGVKRERAAGLAPGQFVDLKVRLAGPKKAFAHPDDEPRAGNREDIPGPP